MTSGIPVVQAMNTGVTVGIEKGMFRVDVIVNVNIMILILIFTIILDLIVPTDIMHPRLWRGWRRT